MLKLAKLLITRHVLQNLPSAMTLVQAMETNDVVDECHILVALVVSYPAKNTLEKKMVNQSAACLTRPLSFFNLLIVELRSRTKHRSADVCPVVVSTEREARRNCQLCSTTRSYGMVPGFYCACIIWPYDRNIKSPPSSHPRMRTRYL